MLVSTCGNRLGFHIFIITTIYRFVKNFFLNYNNKLFAADSCAPLPANIFFLNFIRNEHDKLLIPRRAAPDVNIRRV